MFSPLQHYVIAQVSPQGLSLYDKIVSEATPFAAVVLITVFVGVRLAYKYLSQRMVQTLKKDEQFIELTKESVQAIHGVGTALAKLNEKLDYLIRLNRD